MSSYFTDVDADRYGSLIENHQIWMDAGHDEYWSGNEFDNLMAARNAGVDLAFFSGNTAFWKTYYSNSIDGSNTPDRTLVCYKETHANAIIDPNNPDIWTGAWADPRFSPPADGGIAQNELTGTFFDVNQGSDPVGTPITVPGTDANLPIWRNTAIAKLAPDQSTTIGGQVLGNEWDSDVNNAFRPVGEIDMSSTTQNVTQELVDWGNTFEPGTATHSLTEYRASSGALVFSAGTVQWSWGLSNDHYGVDSLPDPDPNMQQATVNLFADMGAQPGTLQAGLVAATQTHLSSAPPTSAITGPLPGASLPSGTPVTITGTASAASGAFVVAVEVSTDGGQTWNPAVGTTNWTYTWTPGATGPVTIMSRAVDDTVNLGQSFHGSHRHGHPAGDLVDPLRPRGDSHGPGGQRHQPRRAGSPVLLGRLRLHHRHPVLQGAGQHRHPHRPSLDQHRHPPGHRHLHRRDRLRLAGGRLLHAGGYHRRHHLRRLVLRPRGRLRRRSVLFRLVGGQQRSVARGAGRSHRSRQCLTSRVGWLPHRHVRINQLLGRRRVQPDRDDHSAGDQRLADAGANGIASNTAVTAQFNESIQAGTLSFVLTDSNGNAVPATVSFDGSTDTATLTPNASLSYPATYTATISGAEDLNGVAMTSTVSWSFTTSFQPGPRTLSGAIRSSPASRRPATPTRSRSASCSNRSVAGTISGIRFYDGNPESLGSNGDTVITYVVHLWSVTGTLLATANYTLNDDSSLGWQQANFSSPVTIAANTVYVASYYSPEGGYAARQRLLHQRRSDHRSAPCTIE